MVRRSMRKGGMRQIVFAPMQALRPTARRGRAASATAHGRPSFLSKFKPAFKSAQ